MILSNYCSFLVFCSYKSTYLSEIYTEIFTDKISLNSQELHQNYIGMGGLGRGETTQIGSESAIIEAG